MGSTGSKEIGARLKEIREKKGVARKDIAEHLGVTYEAYMFYENGRNEIKASMLANICKYLNVSADYLLGTTFQKNDTDTIDMNSARRDRYNKLDTYGKKAVDSLIDIEHERITGFDLPKSKTVQIMFSTNYVSAGTGEWLDESSEQSRCYPDCKESRRADMVITISGDSMEPDFSDGDEVYVELMDEIPVGKTGIFVYNGKGLIKRFCGDHLESLNKKYKPIWPEEDIPFRTVGLVLGKVDWGDDE